MNIAVAIVGNRGTGKTTWMLGDESCGVKGVIPRYLETDPDKKILIIDTFDHPSYSHIPVMDPARLPYWNRGVYRIFDKDVHSLIGVVVRYVYNAVIVFEDATKYIKDRFSDELRDFIIDSKQRNVDVYFMFHWLMAVPRDFVRIGDWLTLFKTGETYDSSVKSKYPAPGIKVAFDRCAKTNDKHFCTTVSLT